MSRYSFQPPNKRIAYIFDDISYFGYAFWCESAFSKCSKFPKIFHCFSFEQGNSSPFNFTVQFDEEYHRKSVFDNQQSQLVNQLFLRINILFALSQREI